MADWPNLTIRPLTRPGTTPGWSRQRATFTASWSSTLDVLDRELHFLRAQRGVLELDYAERDLRVDGYPRANARMASPSVAIAFESKHGPLRYDTDLFNNWQDNVRAIALGLEALRKVDRYGISKSGEQYRGWKAIENSAEDPIVVLRRHAEDYGIVDPRDLYRLAVKRTHPDTGGSPDAFAEVQAARQQLESSGRWPK